MEVDVDLRRALIMYHSSQRIIEAYRNIQRDSYVLIVYSSSLRLTKTLTKDSEINLEIHRKILADMPFELHVESLGK